VAQRYRISYGCTPTRIAVVMVYIHTHLFITTLMHGYCLNTDYKASYKMDIAANAENRIARICIAKSMSKQNCVQNNAVPEIFSGQLNKVMKVILVISK
jgi:hypothetical protein